MKQVYRIDSSLACKMDNRINQLSHRRLTLIKTGTHWDSDIIRSIDGAIHVIHSCMMDNDTLLHVDIPCHKHINQIIKSE